MKYLDTYVVISIDHDGETELHGAYVNQDNAMDVVDFLIPRDDIKDVWIDELTVEL
jgi:hypothetical protein